MIKAIRPLRSSRMQAISVCVLLLSTVDSSAFGQNGPRARELGIPFEGEPGSLNAITDVRGVEVGHATLIKGDGKLEVGKGPVRTGVTAILPRGRSKDPVFAAWYSLNGCGEMTGVTWIEESGFLEGPVMITNTHSIGPVHEAVLAWRYANKLYTPFVGDLFGALPVVAETYDGLLNDINGFHVKKEHAVTALDKATSGSVAEGNVGGGTGMMCHEFKGGIGTASRRLRVEGHDYTLGVLVQANHGLRRNLTIAGVAVGQEITDLQPEFHFGEMKSEQGSIIAVIATDAPLLPHQLKRIARHVPLGVGRVGGLGFDGSGDIYLVFSTANPGAQRGSGLAKLKMLANDLIDPLFEATVQATEEAIVNALVAAETMTGINGNTVHALPHDRVVAALKKFNRHTEMRRPEQR